MKKDNTSETVRINAELKRRVEKIADVVRPRSTIQYVIEAAIEEYLKAKEERPEYGKEKK